ncbi:MAG: putative porin, partial [Bacteroidales bacterium]|nr:putative porin [Bacteroidales bacterium]
DTLLWSQNTRSGVPVNLYEAASRWLFTSLFVHQSYNTVRQLDSLATPRTLNTGVIGFDVQFDRNKRNFSDSDPSQFTLFFYDTAHTQDSTSLQSLSGRLFWTNDAYPSSRWRNPFVVTVGVKPEVAWSVVDADSRRLASVTPFAQGRLQMGLSTLSLQGETTAGSYRSGDHRAALAWGMPLGCRLRVGLDAVAQRQSPTIFYYHFSGNHARWNYDDGHYAKQGYTSLGVNIDFARDTSSSTPCLSLAARTSQVDNLVLHTGSPLDPFVQHADKALLLQISLKANLSWRWLHVDLFQLVQSTDRDDLLHVPLFASKNSLYADFPLFHGAMRVQAGLDARYFTSFAADEWNAYYGIFLPQDNTKIGGYLWADLFLNAQIKRATFYVKLSHFNAPLVSTPRYFTLPHYPGEDLGLYYGIVWQFYN